MIEALLDFFQLYTADADYLPGLLAYNDTSLSECRSVS